MIKNKKVAFALYVALFCLFWNLLDFLWVTVIAKTGYHFGVAVDLAAPLAVAITTGYLLFLRKKD